MNNVEIFLGKNKPSPQPKFNLKNTLKTITKVQPCPNTSYYNNFQEQSKNALEIIQSKLKMSNKPKNLRT